MAHPPPEVLARSATGRSRPRTSPACVRDLRAPHRRTPGTEDAWQSLKNTLTDLTALAR